MPIRFSIFLLVVLFALGDFAQAGIGGRYRGRHPHKIGSHVTQKVSRVPKKKTPRADAAKPRGKNRGPYPYVGKRKTPKRTYLFY